MSPEHALVASFAAAVADGPGALELGADNTAGRWVTHADAAARDVAFLVVPRRDLLVVDMDLDDPSCPTPADRRRVAAFDALVAAAPAVVVCASGSPGNRHAFVPIDDDAASRSAVTAFLRRELLDVRTRGVRPPLTRHRRAGRSELMGAADAAFDVLRSHAPAGAARHLADTLDVPRLSTQMLDLIRRGPTGGTYPSQSEARCAVAVAVRAAGLPQSYLAEVFNDPANRVAESFRRRNATWRSAELSRLWRLADDRVRSGAGPRRWAADLAQWRSHVATTVHRSMTGGTDLAVLEAFAERCAPRQRTRVSFALGDVAVAAGVSMSTARRALRRLIAAGWLIRLHEPGARRSAVYQLTIPPGTRRAARSATCMTGLGSDLARWRGIGKVSFRVLRELGPAPLGAAEVAGLLSVSRPAARRHLVRLVRAGLARHVGGGWVATDVDPIDVAASLGTAGAAIRQERALVAARRARSALFARLSAGHGRSSPRRPPPPLPI